MSDVEDENHIAEDGAATFLEMKDGEIVEGIVVADLEGEGEGMTKHIAPSFSRISPHLVLISAAPASDDDDEGEEEQGEGAEGIDSMEEDYEDDSIHAFGAHTEGVYAVAWSPTVADLVATGGGDDRAFLWRVGEAAFMENQGDVKELRGHTDTVTALAFSADGSMIASGGMDGIVRIWNPTTGALLHALEGPAESIEWVKWHPRGNVVLAGSADFTVWMWAAATGDFMQVFTGHSGPVTCGNFSFDGKLVVTGGGENDASLRVWDPRSGECKVVVSGSQFHGEGLTSLALHPDSNVAITGSEDGTAKVIALENGRIMNALIGHEENTSVEAVAFIPGLPLAATAGLDGKLIIFDLTTATARAVCEHPAGVTRIAVHPTQPLVFTACVDGVVRCWDVRTGECGHTWKGHTEAVQDICVSGDGSMVLSGGEDGVARVFSLLE